IKNCVSLCCNISGASKQGDMYDHSGCGQEEVSGGSHT
ncbi:hypothetical protein A2U01_0064776, partial [Trifolium medium]|nr:hypothetical protein [Trifolium medium]